MSADVEETPTEVKSDEVDYPFTPEEGYEYFKIKLFTELKKKDEVFWEGKNIWARIPLTIPAWQERWYRRKKKPESKGCEKWFDTWGLMYLKATSSTNIEAFEAYKDRLIHDLGLENFKHINAAYKLEIDRLHNRIDELEAKR
jgi:hypothetical protein